MTVEVLDSLTLQRLQNLEFPRGISTATRTLVFSPDSHILTSSGMHGSGKELFVVSWDLQTGGVASVITWQGPDEHILSEPSITYSANGKMVGVHCSYDSGDNNVILIFDVSSGVLHMRHHSPPGVIFCANSTWTHGESLRLATVGTEDITIWEVGFTSDARLTVAETFPLIDGDSEVGLPLRCMEYIQFHPASYRFAFISGPSASVMVWDVQKSKFLLSCTSTRFWLNMTFSSDGRFFACSTEGSDVYLWEESPEGYVLRRIFASSTVRSYPLLSPNEESIVVLGGSVIQLWHTKGSIATPSTVSTRTPQHAEDFVLDFSPDGMLAAFAMLRGGIVAILDLKSGVPQLTIDASVEVHGLRVTGNAITVIGVEKVITWDLPTGDWVPDAKLTFEDSAWATNLGVPPSSGGIGGSISPDSRYIAVVGSQTDKSWRVLLYLYDRSTEESLGHMVIVEGQRPWFAPGECDLWLVDDDGKAKTIEADYRRQRPLRMDHAGYPPEGYLWKSSRGYRVTDDWWILGPDGKRLLMLPPPWQSSKAVLQMWKGQFLVLLQHGPSEPVILELEP